MLDLPSDPTPEFATSAPSRTPKGNEVSNVKVAVLASAALAASSVLLVAQPASGALVTRCTGVAGAVTVPNDLVVPNGASCVLEGTVVEGDVKVGKGADLLLDGATVTGSLTVVNDAYADVIASSIGGDVSGRAQFGVFIEDSSVGGNVSQRSTKAAQFVPFLYTFGASLGGSVDARAGEVLLESSRLSGDLSSRNGQFADVIDSVVGGAMTVQRNAAGSVVCESEIYGPAVFDRNGETLQIGGPGATGPCEGMSYWGGDVTFTNNTAGATGLDVSNNIVAGNLSGQGNDPAPTGSDNRVRGEVSGQFVDLQPADMSAQRSLSAAEGRSAQLQAKIDERRSGAEKEAAVTPDAQVLTPGNE